ncbi:MAG: arginase family protein [Eggerthellaceae bacterium]|nr:arginase family protein [Eggerthellaceae bacterium]
MGFEELKRQMGDAYKLLHSIGPDKVLAIGGGCDADVPVIAYLNERCGGDFAVVWLDAHGDLNSPEESSTSLFYGMPLRSLMDDTCFGLMENPLPLTCAQVVHAGGRDLDEAEVAFMISGGIARITVGDVRSDVSVISKAVETKGYSSVYVHLDLDVPDPAAFPNTPLPVADGLSAEELLAVLESLAPKAAGMGIFEYAPTGERVALIDRILKSGLPL